MALDPAGHWISMQGVANLLLHSMAMDMGDLSIGQVTQEFPLLIAWKKPRPAIMIID